MRINATKEVETVVREYKKFLMGNGNSEYIVPTVRAQDRLDVSIA